MSKGIVSYAAYVPRRRLQRADLGAALGASAGKGARVVASYDEDSTTMGVEAARRVLKSGDCPPIYFATTSPAYFDKTNANAIHAALDLGHEGFAVDLAGSARSASGAWRAAAHSDGLAVLSDVRTGKPGSADERDGGDAAAAFLFGDEDVVAEIIGEAAATAEFLDRWRAPGERSSTVWEERFGQESYMPLIADAAKRALELAEVDGPDHVIVSSPHTRTAKAAAAKLGGKVAADDPGVGYAGAADAGVKLVDLLDRARPGETILVVHAVDGCDATVLRTTQALDGGRSTLPVRTQMETSRDVLYATYLNWRGMLERELPRRPEPDRPAGPPSARSEGWKFGFVGSRCTNCGRVHVPPGRVCAECGTVDQMERIRLADTEGVVATYTVDRLAYSPSPPVIDLVVDFDGGGRCQCELTDGDPDNVDIGHRVEMTFRRLYTTGGVHNYFWKARPTVNGGS